jgi:hypothetical protein
MTFWLSQSGRNGNFAANMQLPPLETAAHFALLNDEYEGGYLRFPEYARPRSTSLM